MSVPARGQSHIVVVALAFCILVACAALISALVAAAKVRSMQAKINEQAALLDEYAKYSGSDPRNVYAAFTKTVKERSVTAQCELHWTATFKFIKELKDGTAFPADRARVETYPPLPSRQTTRTQSLRGIVLGVRSHTVFALFVLPHNDPGLQFSVSNASGVLDKSIVTPPPVKVSLKSDLTKWGGERHYDFSTMNVSINLVVFDNADASQTRLATLVHAWQNGDHTVLIAGYEVPDAREMKPLPYIDDKIWTRFIELEKPFPVACNNGCIAMTVPKLDRKYGLEGVVLPWQGFSGTVSSLFLPIEQANEPVLHSLIFQIDESHARWMPFWSAQKQMAAANGAFNFPVEYDFEGARSPAKYPPPTDPDKSEREKLLVAFQSLIKYTPVFTPQPATPAP